MLLPQRMPFLPLLTIFPQPSTKLSLTAHYPSTKSGENYCRVLQRARVRFQEERISLKPKGWTKATLCHSTALPSPSPLHPRSMPSKVTQQTTALRNHPSTREEHEAQGYSLPLVFWWGTRITKKLLIIGCCQSTTDTIIMIPMIACGYQ